VSPTPATPAATTETSAATETPVTATPEAKPALKEKRRTSLFNSLGSKKEKSDTEVTEGETKKSPLPQKLGGLFRKPSKAVKSEEKTTEPSPAHNGAPAIAPVTESAGEPGTKAEPALSNGTSEPAKDTISEVTESKPEVKTSA
jgi:hypothetical protein